MRTTSTGILVTLAGVGQLWISNLVGDWASSVLVNTGTAALLFVPLYLVQRSLEKRVQSVQRQTAQAVDDLTRDVNSTRQDVQRSIDELREEVHARLKSETAQDRSSFAALSRSPSFRVTIEALHRAKDRKLIGECGPRVRVAAPDLNIFARLLPNEDSIRILLEAWDAKEVAQLEWRDGKTTDDLMFEVGRALQGAALYHENSFDPGLMFAELSALLQTAEKYVTKYSIYEDYTRAVQLFEPQWMVFEWGIGAYGEELMPYAIPLQRLDPSENWRGHMKEKTWTDMKSFEAAYNAATSLAKAGILSGDAA